MPTTYPLEFDKTGERYFETGVSKGVLFPHDGTQYTAGVAWNGLTAITETPSGAEATALWADNIKYLNLFSTEEFGATVAAYTYPDEFAECDGSAEIATGVHIGQQTRKMFGLCYRTEKGNDITERLGYTLHFIYNAKATPSEKAYNTVNDSPEAINFSWTLSTTPVNVPGYKPTALVTVDSTKVDPNKLADLEEIIYGKGDTAPRLPMPNEIAAIVGTTANSGSSSSGSGSSSSPTYTAVTPVGTENPSTEGWYESDGNGGYTLTADTTVDNTKTYYAQQPAS